MKSADHIKRHFNTAHVSTRDIADKEIIDQLIEAHRQAIIAKPAEPIRNIWSLIMHHRKTTFASAAAAILIAALVTTLFVTSTPVASAATILQDAIDAVSDLTSVHIKAKMRTLPRDNFANIGLNYDFVEINMWKRTTADNVLQWRVEKPGRVLLMDGKSTTMLIRPNYGVLQNETWPLGCFDSWMGRLLNVQELLDNELKHANKNPEREAFVDYINIDGQDKIRLEIEMQAAVSENDYLRNKFIFHANHVKIFQFDAESNLLESLQIYVHDTNDILIFEVTDIDYNLEMDDSVFALDLPEDMVWSKPPEKLANNVLYENMTPKEAATAFFQACAHENWDEALKFWSRSRVDDRTKNYLGGLEIISIGEPFQSEGYAGNNSGWIVPYEIKLRPRELNMVMSNDNPAGRFVITGWYNKDMEELNGMPISLQEVALLEDNETYAKMSAEQAFETFAKALATLDFDELEKFVPSADVDKLRNECEEAKKHNIDIQKQMPIMEINKTTHSEEHNGYIVNYSEFSTKKHNLGIRKDNDANRFIIDGGI